MATANKNPLEVHFNTWAGETGTDTTSFNQINPEGRIKPTRRRPDSPLMGNISCLAAAEARALTLSSSIVLTDGLEMGKKKSYVVINYYLS